MRVLCETGEDIHSFFVENAGKKSLHNDNYAVKKQTFFACYLA